MMEYLSALMQNGLMAISPHASFGCDSGFFGPLALALCLVLFLGFLKPCGKTSSTPSGTPVDHDGSL